MTDAVALPAAFFGPGSSRISYSNLQCNGSEAALTDCTFDTIHQCSHNQDASVMCLVECSDEEVRIALDSEMNSVEYCNNQLWSTCDNACEDMNGGKLSLHSAINSIQELCLHLSITTWSLFLWAGRDHSFLDERFPTI